MRYLYTILLSVLACYDSVANVDCIWTASDKGITISYLATCDPKNQMFLDSVLREIAVRANRNDTSLKILVLVNDASISYPGPVITGFMSIGFDTLRRIDNAFITDYYFGKIKKSMHLHTGKNDVQIRSEPIDINSAYTDTSDIVGIKIIYKTDYKSSNPNWKEVEQLINYATQNSNQIKKLQTRDTVNFDYNTWHVSLLTIDTFQINKILGRQATANDRGSFKIHSEYKYFGLGMIAFLTITSFLIWRGRRSR